MSSSQPFMPLLFLLLSLFAATCSSLTCTTQKLTRNVVYPNCEDLPTLDAYLHWAYSPLNNSLSVAFAAALPAPGGWVSWGINPTGDGMVGAQVLAAFKDDGGAVAVKTLDLKSYGEIIPGKLSFEVWNMRAEEVGGVVRIYATVNVPVKATAVNHVWQVGTTVTAGRIGKHEFNAANMNAKGRLSFNGGQVSGGDDAAAGAVDFTTKKKNIHGVLNALSWGVLFPLGVIIARYMRVFPSADPAWFYLHVGCQLSAYVIGVAGWGTGMKLGSESEGIQFSGHRNIGIALFCLATIQIFSLFIRPNKDHKFRYLWNIYHHSFGYTIIIMGVYNIFRGFYILQPDQKYRIAYINVLIILAALALLLEVITWIVVLKRKCSKSKTYNNNGQQFDI